jgi:hypothetical protein
MKHKCLVYGLLAIGIAILLAFKAYASSVSALYVSEGAGYDAGFGLQAGYDQGGVREDDMTASLAFGWEF